MMVMFEWVAWLLASRFLSSQHCFLKKSPGSHNSDSTPWITYSGYLLWHAVAIFSWAAGGFTKMCALAWAWQVTLWGNWYFIKASTSWCLIIHCTSLCWADGFPRLFDLKSRACLSGGCTLQQYLYGLRKRQGNFSIILLFLKYLRASKNANCTGDLHLSPFLWLHADNTCGGKLNFISVSIHFS